MNLLVDSAGVKFLGDGEQRTRRRAAQGRRKQREADPAMDTEKSDIRAAAFTPSSDGDSSLSPELLDQIPQGDEIATVTADGAYDTRRGHAAVIARGAAAIISIRKTVAPGRKTARQRGSAAGACVRRAVLAAPSGSAGPDATPAARDPDRQIAEIYICIALMNRFTALGATEIARVARRSEDKGGGRLKRAYCINAGWRAHQST